MNRSAKFWHTGCLVPGHEVLYRLHRGIDEHHKLSTLQLRVGRKCLYRECQPLCLCRSLSKFKAIIILLKSIFSISRIQMKPLSETKICQHLKPLVLLLLAFFVTKKVSVKSTLSLSTNRNRRYRRPLSLVGNSREMVVCGLLDGTRRDSKHATISS